VRGAGKGPRLPRREDLLARSVGGAAGRRQDTLDGDKRLPREVGGHTINAERAELAEKARQILRVFLPDA
jgi:hypothetical protein